MKILVSWSSGKDAAWTLHVLRQQHGARVGGLLTTVNEAFDRVAMHGVRRELLEWQAQAVDLPLHIVDLPWPCSNADYERRMAAATAKAAADSFTHVAFGDLFLEDVRRYREERLAGTGLTPLFPLWGLPTRALAHEMVAAGVRAHLTCVDPRWLDASCAGRAFDDSFLTDLPPGVDPCGENGEFHTFVSDAPIFRAALPTRIGDIIPRDGFVFADVVPAGASRARPSRVTRESPR